MDMSLDKHFVATGFVVNKDHSKMLMVYHKKLNKWLPPGGHLEENETPAEAVRREVKEETGIVIKICDTSNLKITPEAGEEVLLENPLFMLAEHIPANKKQEAQPIKRQEEEVENVKWMTWEEITQVDTFGSISGFAKTML